MHDNSNSNHETSQNSSTEEENTTLETMPEWLPQKFWDAENGRIRVRDLVKSYRLLEKKLSAGGGGAPKRPAPDTLTALRAVVESATADTETAPDSPGNETESANDDENDNRENIASENLSEFETPADEAQELLRLATAQDALEQAFGGREQWQKLQPRLAAWGRRNLPPQAYESLAESVDGIKMLHRLMRTTPSETPLVEDGETPEALDETYLRRMMQDPRYWRDRNPQFVKRVIHGFQQLYGN